MLLLLRFYISSNQSEWFWFGFSIGVLAILLFLLLIPRIDNLVKQYNEFTAWKGQKPTEVVDAQFVDVKPRPSNSPQLDSSKSLVRRTSVERRKV